jgi:hypothetical protein
VTTTTRVPGFRREWLLVGQARIVHESFANDPG